MTTRSDTTPSSYTPDAGAPAPEQASLFEDFIEIFYAPSKVFARREKASFWPYFLIIAVVSAIFLFASRGLMSAVMDAEFSRRTAQMLAKNPQLTAEQLASGRKVQESIGTFFSYLGMPLLVFFAGILTWIGARVASAKLDMGRAMLVASLAQVPRLLGGLITAIYGLVLSDVSVVNGPTRLSYGPARFLDPDATNAALLQLLYRLDFFTLWVTVLIGIGIAVIGKVPRSRGYMAAAIIWLIPTLFATVGAIISG